MIGVINEKNASNPALDYQNIGSMKLIPIHANEFLPPLQGKFKKSFITIGFFTPQGRTACYPVETVFKHQRITFFAMKFRNEMK